MANSTTPVTSNPNLLPSFSPAKQRSTTTSKVKYLFDLSAGFYIASALSVSSGVGITLLKLAGQVPFTQPISICIVSSVVLSVLSWIFEDRYFDYASAVNTVKSLLPTSSHGSFLKKAEGVVRIYLSKDSSDFRDRYRDKLIEGRLDDTINKKWKELIIDCLKNYLDKKSTYSKIIFNQISGINELSTGLSELQGQENDTQREDLLSAFAGKEEVWQAYLLAICNPDYFFSIQEKELMAELLDSQVHQIVPIWNYGTDCFMNAAFQVIMHDELLKNALLTTYQSIATKKVEVEDTNKAKANKAKAEALCRAMKLYSEGQTSISTCALRQFMPEHCRMGQQDASEFLIQLMNNVVSDNFPDFFPTQTTIYHWKKLHSDTETKVTSEPLRVFYTILKISSQDQPILGQDLINEHFAKKNHVGERFVDDGIVYVPGEEEVQIKGKRLTFVLKRFDRNNKICTRVDMPEILNLNDNQYALKRVIVHHGDDMGSGHYTSLFQIEGKWINTDDRRISEVEDISENRQNGYIYFYELV